MNFNTGRMYCRYIYLQFIFIFTYASFLLREFTFPDETIAFNNRRCTASRLFGYAGHSLKVSGLLVSIKNIAQVEEEIMKDSNEKVMFALPTVVFVNKSIMNIIISTPRVVGVLLLFGTERVSDLNIKFFSELPSCLDRYHAICDGTVNDLFNEGYYFFTWPIPVVMLKRKMVYHELIHDCYRRYNVKPINKERCKLQINNYSPKYMNMVNCRLWQKSWKQTFSLAHNFQYCKGYNGYNIYITFNNVPFYKERSVILIYTRMDGMSMFDSGAFGVNDLYPSIGAMIYIAKIFQKAAAEMMIDENSDVLMAFVDNFNVEQLGTTRLFYDIINNRINNTVHNISDKNIKLIIYLGELRAISDTLTFITYMCNSNELCKTFKETIITSAKKFNVKLRNQDFDFLPDRVKLWKSIPVPAIDIRSSVVTQNLFRHSFLDIEETKDLPFLENISKTIAMTVIKMVASQKQQTTEFDATFSEYSPSNLSHCMLDISCQLFQWIIGPEEKEFYYLYANPFVAQSFIDQIIDAKQLNYANRLSFFVLRILVVLLQTRQTSNKLCQSNGNIKYFETKIQDKTYCFETKIQVEDFFDLDTLINGQDDKVMSRYYSVPLYKKVVTYTRQEVRLHISHDADVTNALMVIYTIFFVLCLLGSLFINRSIHVFISEDDF